MLSITSLLSIPYIKTPKKYNLFCFWLLGNANLSAENSEDKVGKKTKTTEKRQSRNYAFT